MYKVTIPPLLEKVSMHRVDGSVEIRPMPYEEFMALGPLNDRGFIADLNCLSVGLKLSALFVDAKPQPGDVVPVQESWYKMLAAACRTPVGGYNFIPEVARQLYPYYLAILEAVLVPDEVEKAPRALAAKK